MKKIFSIVFAFCLIAAIAVGVYGDTNEDIQNLEEEKDALEQELSDSQGRLEELQNTELELHDKIVAIVDEISAVELIIADYQEEIDDKNAAIDELQADIDDKQSYIDDQYDKMGMRIKFIYENLGDDFFMNTLFSSGSISEVFEKTEYLKTLNEYDKSMMEKMKTAKEEVEEKKSVLETRRTELVTLKEAEEGQKDVLDQLKAAQEEELENIGALEAQEEAMIDALNSEIQDRIDTINELTEKSNSEQGNYGGTFLWPLPAYYGTNYITSGYGWREGTYSGFHAGIDIGAPTGTPIYAVASGTVVASYYSDSAGNFTIIYHGNGIYTEYMHQSERYVYAGQQVAAGEVIGLVGNTGWSTGSHLHFGVVASDYGYSTDCRTDPGPYLGLY